jgi:hypothetical protein
MAFTIAQRVRTNSKLSESERTNGIKIVEIVIKHSPDILYDTDH